MGVLIVLEQLRMKITWISCLLMLLYAYSSNGDVVRRRNSIVSHPRELIPIPMPSAIPVPMPMPKPIPWWMHHRRSTHKQDGINRRRSDSPDVMKRRRSDVSYDLAPSMLDWLHSE